MTAYFFGGYVAVTCEAVGCQAGIRVTGTKSAKVARQAASTRGYRFLQGRDWCPNHKPGDSDRETDQ